MSDPEKELGEGARAYVDLQFKTGDAWTLGYATKILIEQARLIASPRREPTKAKAIKAANAVADKVEKALTAVRAFEGLWENSCPFVQQTHSKSTVVEELEQIARHYRQLVPFAFESFSPRFRAAVELMKDLDPDLWMELKPEGVSDFEFVQMGLIPPFVHAGNFQRFVEFAAADVYERHFGKASYTEGGPFSRFVEFVLYKAGIAKARETIRTYRKGTRKPASKAKPGKANSRGSNARAKRVTGEKTEASRRGDKIRQK